jgi:hypothetical protein
MPFFVRPPGILGWVAMILCELTALFVLLGLFDGHRFWYCWRAEDLCGKSRLDAMPLNVRGAIRPQRTAMSLQPVSLAGLEVLQKPVTIRLSVSIMRQTCFRGDH